MCVCVVCNRLTQHGRVSEPPPPSPSSSVPDQSGGKSMRRRWREKSRKMVGCSPSLSLFLSPFPCLSLSLSLVTRARFHHSIRDAAWLHEYSSAELTVGRILHIGHHEQQQGCWVFFFLKVTLTRTHLFVLELNVDFSSVN